MNADLLNYVLLGSMMVLLAAVIAVRLATRAGLPALLAFLALGLALGEGGIGIQFDDPQLMQVLGFVALAIILAEGGLSTKWADIRPSLVFALLLSTVGVAVSVTITAIVGHYALGLDWRIAILVGAVVSSTDAAAVFSILRYLPLRARVRSALEAESGLNDPPVVILVTLVVSDAWAQTGILATAGEAVYQLLGGAAFGIFVGMAGQWLLTRSALPVSGLYPAATFGLPLLAFGGAGVLGASGFLAAYVCGLWLGNAPLPHRNATLGFAEGVAWLAQIALFTLLGMLASPAELPAALIPALVIGASLTLVARPASVMVSAISLRLTRIRIPPLRLPGRRPRQPSTVPVCRPCWRIPLREQAFLSWAGLRGAVPIVLATIPQSEDVAGADGLFDIVFVLVIIFTLLQGPPLPWIARRLGISVEGSTQEVNVDSAPIEERHADLLTVNVTKHCELVGRQIQNLGLPPGALVTLLVRGESSHVPSGETILAQGDRFIVITTHTMRAQVQDRLNELTNPPS